MRGERPRKAKKVNRSAGWTKSPPPHQSLTTGMIPDGKKAGPRLRDPASWLPLAAVAISRNLGSIFFTILVQSRAFVPPSLEISVTPLIVCSDFDAPSKNPKESKFLHLSV